MKYWIGYFVAAIVGGCAYLLERFAETHAALVDMVYPYATRMTQTFLAEWSATVDFCLWQVLLVAFAVLILATAVLVVVLKGNPIRWLGWVLAAVSVVVLLNTGIYGLNKYAGPITQDIRLEEADYTVEELGSAAKYYLSCANKLSDNVPRENGQIVLPDLDVLNQHAAQGFETMKTQNQQSVFAGSTVPVKVLGWENYYASRGIDGVMVGLTGEAAVNMKTPAPMMPFAIARVMAQRMCIANTPDANMAAFLVCRSNESGEYRYAGYLAAYYCCRQVLQQLQESAGYTDGNQDILTGIQAEENQNVKADLLLLDDFYKKDADAPVFCRYLVSLHIQEQVLPQLQEEEVLFDPMDEGQVDLSGIVNASGD